MPLGRVILAASEASVIGQASRNSSATNIAICLIRDQLQSNGPSLLLPEPHRGRQEGGIVIIIAL